MDLHTFSAQQDARRHSLGRKPPPWPQRGPGRRRWLATQVAYYEQLARRETMRGDSITPETWQRQTRIAACELKARTYALHAQAFRQLLRVRHGGPAEPQA